MPRLVHLAPESRARAILRGGIRPEEAAVVGVAGTVPRAVFAMPILPDFSITYQWLRELRRWRHERMIAVHFVAPSEELVLVGRYNRPHDRLPLGEAVRRVLAAPAGNEIVVTRRVKAAEIAGVRAISQLVGWTEVPEPNPGADCLCVGCVGRGTTDLMRRVRAACERHLLEARRAESTDDVVAALSRLETPLERARGRLPSDKLLVFARAEDARVRSAATSLLGYFRWAAVERALAARLVDEDSSVREAAVGSLVAAGGVGRTYPYVARVKDDQVTEAFIEHLEYARDAEAAAALLEEIAAGAGPEILERLASAAAALLLDDDLPTETRARLGALAEARGSQT